jgi:hypothetical protein
MFGRTIIKVDESIASPLRAHDYSQRMTLHDYIVVLFVHKVLKLIIALELRSGTVSIWPSAPPSFSQRESERLRSIGQNGSALIARCAAGTSRLIETELLTIDWKQ